MWALHPGTGHTTVKQPCVWVLIARCFVHLLLKYYLPPPPPSGAMPVMCYAQLSSNISLVREELKTMGSVSGDVAILPDRPVRL